MRIPFKEINWLAFDDRKFLSDSGVEVDPNKGLPGILEAIYKCFKPRADTSGSVLDTTTFNQTILTKFVTEVMATIGYEPTSEQIDPALSKNLFKRWFLQIASPPSGSGNGGNTMSPFHDLLLRVTHPGSSHRSACGNAGSAEAQSPLPRIAALRNEVGQQYSRTYQPFQAGSIVEWAEWVESTIDGLFEIFEPAMARKDLPESFRYGSLDWALLTIGIDLVGDAHMELPYDQLILLGAAADVFSDVGGPDDTQAGEEVQAFRQKCMHTILRMAHVQGKIDLLGKREVPLEDVETALTFFQSQSRSLESESAPYEEMIDGLQTRSDVAKAMLREKKLDPDQLLAVSRLTTRGGVIGTQRLYRPTCTPDTVPTPQSMCAPLHEIFMMDWHDQLRFDKTLNGEQKQLLETLSHKALEARFKKGFDDVLTRLKREVMEPALRKQYQSLSAENQRFLECGEWKVKIVTDAAIITDGGIGSGGLGPTASRIKKNRMTEAVLIESTLVTDGKPETRRYWATLNPFEIRPYSGSDKELFQNEELLPRFFKPLKEGDKLLAFVASSDLQYRTYSAQSAGERPERRIVALLLEDVAAKMQKAAHETTGPETIRADRKKFWLHLLVPFFSCVESLHSGETKKAISDCTLDVLSAASFAGSVAKAGRTMLSMGRQMTLEQIKSVANALIRNRVGKDHALNTISNVLNLGAPAKEIGAATVRYLDPVIGPTADLLYGAARVLRLLGGRGAGNLIEKLEKVPTAAPFIKKMQEARRSRGMVVSESGFRPIVPDAVVPSRHLQVAAIENAPRQAPQNGAVDRVETIQVDAGRRTPPAPGAPNTLKAELAPASNSGADAVTGGEASWEKFKKAYEAGLCRVKRAGDEAFGECILVPDPLFGPHGYTRQTRNGAVARVYQASLFQGSRSQAPSAPFTEVNGVHLGYATRVRSASGKITDIVPDDTVRFAHRPGGVNGRHSTLHLPDTIDGHIESLVPESGGPAVDYAVFTINHFDALTGATIFNRRWVPFGSHVKRDGTRVHIAYLDPDTPYVFETGASGLPLARPHPAITLRRATKEETDMFWCFQRTLSTNQRIANPLVADAVKLGRQTPDVQARFEEVFEHSKTMLEDAIKAMESDDLKHVVAKMGSKLLGMPVGTELYAVLNTIWTHLTEMRKSLPYLKEQSPHVIGFFKGAQASGDLVLANTLKDAMKWEFNFESVPEPVITFKEEEFMDPLKMVTKFAASTLLHEWGHALRGWIDKMNPASANPVYARIDHETVDLSALMAAARQAAFDPASKQAEHAPLVEHFTVMAASLVHGDNSVRAYIDSPDSETYTITVTDADFRLIFQDPIFDSLDPSPAGERRKRSVPPFPMPDDPVLNALRSRGVAGERSAATRRPVRSSIPTIKSVKLTA